MANNIGVGALGYIAYGKESTEGTFVTANKFLAATSFNFEDTNDYMSPLTIRGSSDMTLAMTAPFNVNGSLELPLVPEDIELLLKSAFSASSVTTGVAGVASAYSHVFTPAAVSPTFTFEAYTGGSDGLTTDGLIRQYSGIRVNTLELKASFGEMVTATVGLDGSNRQVKALVGGNLDPLSPTYAASSLNPFHFNGAKVVIAGSDAANVKDVTFSINNNVSHIGTLRQTRAYSRVASGARELTLSMSMDFQNITDYNRLINEDEFAVSLVFKGGLITGSTYNTLTIDLPRVKYKKVGIPISAGDLISQDVECTVLKPNASSIATITLVNGKSAAVAGL
jgi:hypothetical protein